MATDSAHAASHEDWQPVIDLCGAVAADLPSVASRVVGRIRQEIPDYHVIDRTEHLRGVTQQYEGVLNGIATRRPPSREENDRARALGSRRAREGLPLESVIGAYHVGYREMWNELLTRANEKDPGLSAQLVRLVGTVWEWIQRSTSAAADAYGEVIRAEESAQLSLTYRFLDAIVTGTADATDLTHLAHALAFDPAGGFQAVCSPADAWADADLAELRERMRRRRGAMRCANRGTAMVALVQDIPADVLVGTMRERKPNVPIGVGLVRMGLAGAVASVVDAQEAVLSANGGTGVADFRRDWLLATVRPQADRLSVLLERCREPAEKHPELAETVREFAANGLSLAAAGRVLHVHANTLRYRLDRWCELTGWDVRTWDGLSASMVGLGLFAPEPAARAGH